LVVHWGAAAAAQSLATDSAAAIVRAASQLSEVAQHAELDLQQDSVAVADWAAQQETKMAMSREMAEGALLDAELMLDWAQSLALDWKRATPSAPARQGARAAVAFVTAAVVLREVAQREQWARVEMADFAAYCSVAETLARAKELAAGVQGMARAQAVEYWASARWHYDRIERLGHTWRALRWRASALRCWWWLGCASNAAWQLRQPARHCCCAERSELAVCVHGRFESADIDNLIPRRRDDDLGQHIELRVWPQGSGRATAPPAAFRFLAPDVVKQPRQQPIPLRNNTNLRQRIVGHATCACAAAMP